MIIKLHATRPLGQPGTLPAREAEPRPSAGPTVRCIHCGLGVTTISMTGDGDSVRTALRLGYRPAGDGLACPECSRRHTRPARLPLAA